MQIVMIGAGYVGLTTGACLAQMGHSVVCVDIDAKRVADLRKAIVPIFEPGLDELIESGLANGRLDFTADVRAATAEADMVFLAVGTPSAPNGEINLSYIEAAARQVAPALKPGATVVIKSTVVAGTAQKVREIIAEEREALDFSVASNPEFLREGSAIGDFMEPDRIVVGTDDQRTARRMKEVYAPLIAKGAPFISTSTVNAELIKYAANAFLALKIGFINDVADLCEKVEGDVSAVSRGIGLDRRIGGAFLEAGPGFGGSCFPKDTRAFAAIGRKNGAPQTLIETLIERNEMRKRRLAKKIVEQLRHTAGRGGRVAVLGVAFKANTDDAREAAALTIVPLLREAGLTVSVHDPRAKDPSLRGVAWSDCPYRACKGADAVVVLTEWEEYRKLDLARLIKEMKGNLLFDYRNLFDREKVLASGFRHVAIGRAPAEAQRKPVKRIAHPRWSDSAAVAMP